VRLDIERAPISKEAEAVAAAIGTGAEELALNRGEDFELLFTVKSSDVGRVIDSLEKETGTQATVIGEVSAGSPEVRAFKDGKPFDVGKKGFDHFG